MPIKSITVWCPFGGGAAAIDGLSGRAAELRATELVESPALLPLGIRD